MILTGATSLISMVNHLLFTKSARFGTVLSRVLGLSIDRAGIIGSKKNDGESVRLPDAGTICSSGLQGAINDERGDRQ